MLTFVETLTQDLLVNYLKERQHPELCDLIAQMQSMVEELRGDRMVAVALTSVLLGGIAFEGLPKMLQAIENEARIMSVLADLECHLQKYFLRDSANWMTQNWEHLER